MRGTRLDKSKKATNTKSVNSKKLDMFTLSFFMLPFHSVRSIDKPHEGINQNDSTLTEAANEYLEALTSRPNQLRLVHINTQSMISLFDELVLLIKEYLYDVITMSETWLKNNPLLSYVTIPGYSNIFRNHDDIRGGGEGVYLKDAIDF